LNINDHRNCDDRFSTRITDLAGSTLALVNSSDNVTAQYTYDPFGNVTASGQNIPYPYQYAGMALDQTGLYFNGSSYYDPALGRLLEGYGAPHAPGGGQGGGAASPSGGAGGGGMGLFGSFASPGAAVNGAIGAGAEAAFVAGYAGYMVATAGVESGLTYSAAVSAALGPPGWIAAAVILVAVAVLDFFGIGLFGGGSRPTPPPMLYRFFHYVAAEFLGLLPCLAPNIEDSGPQMGRYILAQYVRGPEYRVAPQPEYRPAPSRQPAQRMDMGTCLALTSPAGLPVAIGCGCA
jgi:hypothetical protein